MLILFAGFGLASLYYLNIYPTRLPKVSQAVEKQPVVYEDSQVTATVKNDLPSVITVGIDTVMNNIPSLEFNPSDPFSPPIIVPGQKQEVKQNIGSGFIVSADGFIITNKHVVSDTPASYQVITSDGKKYNVVNIYRDPLNDLAVLKINASGLKPLNLGDSTSLELGQTVIAIGTPLGEFQNTVTTGVISGLGRGISAGSLFQGSVEQLNNVIQTDAAINPGNSGGPLLNLQGEVIGINTAISSQGQNIGFAIPISSVKNVLNNFKINGGFSYQQPYLGVRYQMVNKNQGVLNNIPAGAYVAEVVSGSPADKAGIQVGDVITKFGQTDLQGNNGDELASLVLQKKVGDKVNMTLFRNNQTITVQVVLQSI